MRRSQHESDAKQMWFAERVLSSRKPVTDFCEVSVLAYLVSSGNSSYANNTKYYSSEGYYTDEDEPADMKTSQHLCPEGFYCDHGLHHACEAGSYGASTGLSDKSCDGSCLAGYYCLSASTSPHQFPCGNSTVYCPEGSKLPSLVDGGYYSAPENDIIVADFYAGPNSTHQMQGKIPFSREF